MRKEIWLGKKSLRFYYYRYRDSSYYSLSILAITFMASIILLFKVIIPQVNDWFSIRNEVTATTARIATIKNNIQFMNTLDKSVLDSQLQTASTAVPVERDFSLILNSLSDAAIRSAVSLDDFNFQVGNVDSSKNRSVDPTNRGLSVIRISLVAHGQFENIKRFVQDVESTLPLSEVVSMNGSSGGVAIVINFYQKSFPNIIIKNDEPLTDLAPVKRELLEKLSSWKPQPIPAVVDASPASGSDSAVPLF